MTKTVQPLPPLAVLADYVKEHWLPDPVGTPLFFSRASGIPFRDLDVRESTLPHYYIPSFSNHFNWPLYSESLVAVLRDLGVTMDLFDNPRTHVGAAVVVLMNYP